MMNGKRQPRIMSAGFGRWYINLYPPFLFNRIRIIRVDPDYMSMRIRIGRSLLTRNLNGTIFGGTIFSAADPAYSIMYWQVFARRGMGILTWLKSARIRYLAPARTSLIISCSLTEEEVRQAAEGLERDGRFTRTHSLEAYDVEGTLCAVIETEVYLGLPPV